MIVIDIGTKRQFEQGHVEGAKWFDVTQLMQGITPDVPKSEEIILSYQQDANVVTYVIYMLRNYGYTNVTDGGNLDSMAKRGFEIAC